MTQAGSGDGSGGDGDGENTGGSGTGQQGGQGYNSGQGNSDQSGGRQSGGGDSGHDDDDLSEFLAELGLTPAQAKARLRNAPKWEKRARENFEGAQKSGTLEKQLGDLQSALADRDARDVQRAGRLALTQVRAKLGENGVNPADVSEILDRVSTTDLLRDGEPDDSAVEKLAQSLLKVAGRAQPDPDQGKKGDANPAEDLNAFIRRAAGRGQRTIRG